MRADADASASAAARAKRVPPSLRQPAAREASRALAVELARADAAEVPKGLVYVTDASPGYSRVKRGEGFAYRKPDGSWLEDEAELARIRKLAIPPAYVDVWVAMSPRAHLQATGRDARGRKQYRYHPDWRTARDADKFEHMLAFGRALPRIRAKVSAKLRAKVGKTPERELVLATLVRLLDTTLVRVGNDEYARENGSFGLTTLRDRHVAVRGSVLRLRFKGKSGVEHRVTLDDPKVARVVQRCQQLPGQELFQYEDEAGEIRSVDSADVNDYLRGLAGEDVTAKDFRTWHATVHALDLMCVRCAAGPVSKREVNEVLAQVCARLGNTVAVCRKSYVHPGVLDAESLAQSLSKLEASTAAVPPRGLDADERRLMRFLAQASRKSPRRRESTSRATTMPARQKPGDASSRRATREKARGPARASHQTP